MTSPACCVFPASAECQPITELPLAAAVWAPSDGLRRNFHKHMCVWPVCVCVCVCVYTRPATSFTGCSVSVTKHIYTHQHMSKTACLSVSLSVYLSVCLSVSAWLITHSHHVLQHIIHGPDEGMAEEEVQGNPALPAASHWHLHCAWTATRDQHTQCGGYSQQHPGVHHSQASGLSHRDAGWTWS